MSGFGWTPTPAPGSSARPNHAGGYAASTTPSGAGCLQPARTAARLDGKPKDEALRAAQMELIAAPIEYINAEGETVMGHFSVPYHWAAFQLIGDWQ